MADKEIVKNPKYAPVLQAMRSLIPVIYLRTDTPEVIPKLISDTNTHGWGFFHSTDRNTKSIVPAYEPRQGPWRAKRVGFKPVEDRSPLGVINEVLECDPWNDQGFSVIQVENTNTISSLSEPLTKFVNHRFDDSHWIVQTWFVGTLAPSQAVPEELRDYFYPIDIIEGTKVESVDNRVRKAALTGDALRSQVLKHASDLGKDKEVSTIPESLDGLDRNEILMALFMSQVNTRKGGRTIFDLPTIDQVRHRWARVP